MVGALERHQSAGTRIRGGHSWHKQGSWGLGRGVAEGLCPWQCASDRRVAWRPCPELRPLPAGGLRGPAGSPARQAPASVRGWLSAAGAPPWPSPAPAALTGQQKDASGARASLGKTLAEPSRAEAPRGLAPNGRPQRTLAARPHLRFAWRAESAAAVLGFCGRPRSQGLGEGDWAEEGVLPSTGKKTAEGKKRSDGDGQLGLRVGN